MARIMIADDSASVRFLISVLVAIAGHQVTAQAENGFDALTSYFQINPDLLIIDAHIRYLDGYAVVNTIRRLSPNAKFVLFTGYYEVVKNRLIQAEQVIMLPKPFDNDAFMHALKLAL